MHEARSIGEQLEIRSQFIEVNSGHNGITAISYRINSIFCTITVNPLSNAEIICRQRLGD
jgi:hypothetical protein